MRDIQGIEFTKGQRVAYVYQPYSSAAIKLLTGFVSRMTEKTVFIVQLQENIGDKIFERAVKPTRAVIIGV